MRTIILILLALISVSCTSVPIQESNTLVLKYEDFGPQVIAHEILGMEWWQWNEHGDSRPSKYNILVVVYRNIDQDAVSKLYPVNVDLKHDYRYLKLADAIQYLKDRISENIEPSVTSRLKSTLAVIDENF
jgi:hypothetical protein